MKTTAMLQILSLLLFFSIPHFSNSCLDKEREALIHFKNGLKDPENRLSSWRGSNCCQWRGIQCENTTTAVIAIDLHNPHPQNLFEDSDSSSRYGFWNLSGEVRPSLKNLKSLKHLDLSFNTFNGISIPEFFGSLNNLQHLNLSNAGFSGGIPSVFGNLSSLLHLDLSSNFISVHSLEWIAGIGSLKYLSMDEVDLSMVGSDWVEKLDKLSSLTELHLAGCELSGFGVPSLTRTNFSSLAVIELDDNHFNSELPNWLVNLTNLQTISLSNSGLHGRIPLGFSALPSLKLLDLSGNEQLTANCSQLFGSGWQKIQVISLANNKLHGQLPASFVNMTSLVVFDLFYNKVEGVIPSSIGELFHLKIFNLSYNSLTGNLPQVLTTRSYSYGNPLNNLQYLGLASNQLVGTLPEWFSQLENLVELDLAGNSLDGRIPASFGSLRKVSHLDLGHNKLNGTLPVSLGNLSGLSLLDVSFNQLTGIVTESHFSNLSKLKILRLSSNYLMLKFGSNWIPSFQVSDLLLESCHLGPTFPGWLKSQKEIKYLILANANISGSIPNWFWELVSNLLWLDVSFNQLHGQLRNPFNASLAAYVDFSSNFFEGPIPLPVASVMFLDLSNNTFTGHIPETIGETLPKLSFLFLYGNRLTGHIPASIGNMKAGHIVLSNNMLNGSIPFSIGNCEYLEVLDLSNNNLSGEIPSSLGQLGTQLQTIHLSNNKLSGHLPQALQNLTYLETLDVGNNMLTGSIPSWIADFQYLSFLRLRSNRFFGEIPTLLSNLTSLRILDLADNQLNGTIPASFVDFKAMSQIHDFNNLIFYGSAIGGYYENMVVNLKGSSQKFTNTPLSLVIIIDLYGNKLSGDLPQEITKLSGLVVLNLSKNRLRGDILERVAKLTQLQSLDLSSNKFSGSVPQSLSSLSFLGYLNLSNNEFSGMIPYTGHLTTFDAPTFAGNPGLCGPPLAVSCPDSDHHPDKGGRGGGALDDDDFLVDKWFYLSVGLGFAAGVLVPFLILATRKSWSYAYFGFVDEVFERMSRLRT